MHRAAGKPHPRRQCLTLRVQAREGRQQRGVDVDHPIAPSLHQAGIEKAHEAGERHQLDAMPPQGCIGHRGEDAAIALADHLVRDAGLRRVLQPLRLAPVADDQDDLGRIGGVGRRFDQRLQVRAAPRDQHANPEPGHQSASAFGRQAGVPGPAVDGVAAQTAL
jgi:hypothetical protein